MYGIGKIIGLGGASAECRCRLEVPMAIARPYTGCALVMGVLSSAEDVRDRLFEALEDAFGPVLKVGPSMDFPYTDYYDDEMGARPVRYFVMFRDLVDPSSLADIKTTTNALELSFAVPPGNAQGRRINLDPGILSLSSFILATCKDRSHRIPLRDGIYGETTLIYQDKDFQRLPWTYADYSSDEVKAVLRSFRDEYRRILREGSKAPER